MEILKRASAYFARRTSSQIAFGSVQELGADGFPVEVACAVLKYQPRACTNDAHERPAAVSALMRWPMPSAAIHTASGQTYGVRRIHAELPHGHSRRVSRKRVWHCVKLVRPKGAHRRSWRRSKPAAASWRDLANRCFVAEGADRLWVTDMTQHRTCEGWVYAALVLDVFSRRVVGWSMADHLRTDWSPMY